MAEEYILLKDLNKAAKEFDLDKTTMNIISIEVPTHSFESLDEEKVLRIMDTGGISQSSEALFYEMKWQVSIESKKALAKAICQHFKKAEGDNKELIKKINDLRKVCGCGEDNEPTWETPYCEMTLDKVVEIIQVLDKEVKLK